MNDFIQILMGVVLGIAVAVAAYRSGALSESGAVAASVVGGIVFGLGGLAWALVLLTFFVSSSALSRLAGMRKTSLAEKFSKGHRRDWAQVLANGGFAAGMVLLHAFFPEQPWTWIAFTGGLAAVNADTWATEIGVLSKAPPRLITSGKVVERGTSGGITLLGTLASLSGAALIGVVAGLFSQQLAGMSPGTNGSLLTVGAALLGGLLGSLADSWLGATQQGIFYCPTCKKETERYPLHTCGTPTEHRRGRRWLNNDLVNLACSLVGAWAAISAVIPFIS